jgi:thiamine biosynthesis lipoprotein ApbE
VVIVARCIGLEGLRVGGIMQRKLRVKQESDTRVDISIGDDLRGWRVVASFDLPVDPDWDQVEQVNLFIDMKHVLAHNKDTNEMLF